MEVYVNEKLLPIELEDEKTAFDVIKGITDFFAKEKVPQFVTKILINGNEYSFADDDSLKAIEISSINKIEFEFKDIITVSKLSVERILSYLDLLKQHTLENKWNDFFSNIEDSLNWIESGMNQITEIFSLEQEISSVKLLFTSELSELKKKILTLSDKNFPLPLDTVQNIIASCEKLKVLISKVLQLLDLSFIGDAHEGIILRITEIMPLYDDLIPVLPEVSVLLQKACDKDAMEIIQKLTTIIDGSIPIFLAAKNLNANIFDNFEINGASFDSFFDSLTEHLRELVSTIENKDSVMIGDLVEYEFLPNIEEMKELLRELKNRLLNEID
ncbi:MAG: hypothetical protein J1G30_04885 [Spirochaetales bacterium]|nr:hypothetical protein [Spirochaetales bacterium]